MCGRQHEIALVFAVFVVSDDDHLTGLEISNQFLDRIKFDFAHSLNSP